MLISSKKKLYEIVFFVCASLLMTLGFYNNSWNASNQIWFDNFQLGMESHVIGRMAIANHEGIFSKGGLTGNFLISSDSIDINQRLHQYNIYEKGININPDSFLTYDSQTGGQALTFSILEKVSPLSRSNNIHLFRFITSAVTAIIIAYFLLWTFNTFGLSTAIITLVLLLFSQWLTVFGKNLWWSLWSFYLPFIVLLKSLSQEKARLKRISFSQLFFLVLVSVFLKCFYTGFEYITTTLIMLCSTLVYYFFEGNWGWMKFVKRLSATVAASFSAIIFAFILLAYQLSFIKGSMTEGFNHIYIRFLIRTSGTCSEHIDPVIQKSLNSKLHEVLARYWHLGEAFNLNNLLSPGSQNKWLIFDFGDLITLILLFSLLLVLPKINSMLKGDFWRDKSIALVGTCLFSILAPLSWLIIFKAHSYIHLHMNFIVWYMPFALFGFIVIGRFLTVGINSIWKAKRIPFSKLLIGQMLVCCIIAYSANTLVDGTIWHYKMGEVLKTPKYQPAKVDGIGFYLLERTLYFVKERRVNEDPVLTVKYNPLSSNAPLGKINVQSIKYSRFENKMPFWSQKNKWMIASWKLPAYKVDAIKIAGVNSNNETWEISIERKDQILPTK